MRAPAAIPAASGRQQQPLSNCVRSIVDLKKLIDDFLSKIEGALYTPYSLARAQKDYESIAMALAIVEKGMDEKDMLHVSDKDFMSGTSRPSGSTLEELMQRAVQEKYTVDNDFQKIASAAGAAGLRPQQ